MRKKITLIIYCTSLFFFLSPAFAVDSTTGLGCSSGTGNPFGPVAKMLCDLTTNTPSDQKSAVGNELNTILSKIIGFLTIVASLWFVIQVIIGGYQWISSGGDKHGVEQARDKMTWAFVGLLVVVLGWVIAGLLGKILGLDILNPGSILPSLTL